MMTDLRQLTLDPTLTESTFYKPISPATDGNRKRSELFERYRDRMTVAFALNRSLVSFQANKTTPFYRWFKYREGFSHELVRYFLDRFPPESPERARILDPFAGAGTTLTTSTKLGWQA